jgi:hypothetical protein
MKFLFAFLSLGFAQASLPFYGTPKANKPVELDNIKVDSPLGAKLLSKARKLEENEVDFTWVADFSIKFQGCHHISQWNDEANEDADVRISTKRLIRFRLCPTSSCSATSGGGCSSGYGDYIIDMNTFLQSYYEAVGQYNEYRCEYISQMECDCQDDDGKGDDFDRDICEYDCYVEHGVEEICADRNPYNDDQNRQEKFELREYVECKEYKNNNNNRMLEENQVQYFLGPYCSQQGGSIFLGLFTDDTCTTFADSNGGADTYYTMAGDYLPYKDKTIITMDCFSCKEPEDFNNEGNDADDGDQVMEMCEQIYGTAGKCESGLAATGYVAEPNENACNYIAGIKVVRKDGIITQVGSKANKTASIFIGIFVVAFVLLAAYVYYLKTKLDRASINLSE